MVAALMLAAPAGDLQAQTRTRTIKHIDHGFRPSVHVSHDDNGDFWDEDTSFDLDDGTIIISHEYYKGDFDVVEITDDYKLIINDEEVELTPDQRELVKEFHVKSMEVVDMAKQLGWKGAKIGVEGAKLGVKAVACLFKLMLSEYDTDDYEAEMEREADAIEEQAELLEEEAEEIEWMVDDLRELAYDMRDKIPAVDNLGWF
jgi:hypothetical protein